MADKEKDTSSARCPDCTRLWDEYTQATKQQLALLEQMSSLGKDFQKVRDLELRIEAAAAAREQAWQKIQEHESQTHTGKPRGQ